MKNITISTKFFDDERIIAISGEFGITGEICAIKLLCEIRKNGYYLEWTTLKQNFLARTFGVNPDELRQIVNRLAEYGFFSREMLEKENVLTTEELQRIYFRPKSRRRDISNIPYLIVTLQPSEPDPEHEVSSSSALTKSIDLFSGEPIRISDDIQITVTDSADCTPQDPSDEFESNFYSMIQGIMDHKPDIKSEQTSKNKKMKLGNKTIKIGTSKAKKSSLRR